ncbi:YIP1 family protein [Silanimonas sp.]|uniref:YIP1 family protein n=1 Tax=Silanimonas sp. TaxID=1929290 RepID=UPI0022BC8C9E|nr:YIP1 family protein [Silanimonas sp.]MCZ8166515.1 YIP1 family protein [Silanimonas sp.]
MKLVDIFLDPAKVFTAEKDKPTFLLPMAIMVAVSAGMILAYYLRVDPVWFQDFSLTMMGQEMTPAEIAQAKQFMPSAKVQGYIGAAATLIFVPIMYAVFALYFFLAGKIAGAGLSYKHGLSLATWAAMPTALGALVATISALTMAPQTPLHAISLTRIDPLLVQLPFDHALSTLAKGFDLLGLWAIALGAIGWRAFTRSGWASAVVVAALPSVLIYGIWLLIALL